MPHFKSLSLFNPIILQSASSFTRVSEINPVLSTAFGHAAVQGDLTGRGACHFHSNNLKTVLLRGTASLPCPNITQAEGFTEFADDFVPGPAPNFAGIRCLKTIDGHLWLLGFDIAANGKVLAIPEGSDLTAPGSYTNRSGDLAVVGTDVFFIVKAADTGYLYYIIRYPSGVFGVMRGTGPASVFSDVCTTPIVIGVPSAYCVNDSGSVQMLFASTGAYRSLDGGVTWAPLAVPLAPSVTEVTYSKKYNRWCISNEALNVVYTSTNNGDSWTLSQWATVGGNFNARTRITHLERLDVEGRYILAVSGFRTIYPAIYTYLSEDGGGSWVMSQVLRVPNYDPAFLPSGSTIVLVNSGSRVFLYQGNTEALWNYDNSAFVTPILNFSTP